MAEDHARESEDQKSRQRDAERGYHSQRDLGMLTVRDTLPVYPGALLGDRRLGGRGNVQPRTSVMQQAQQTHGNRAVQRYIQRSVAVQRCGDTPCGCSAEEKARHALEERVSGGATGATGVGTLVSRMVDLSTIPLQ